MRMRWGVTSIQILAFLGAGVLIGGWHDPATAQSGGIANERGGIARERGSPQLRPQEISPELWEALGDEIQKSWGKLTPEQQQQALDRIDSRMNPSSADYEAAQRRIEDMIGRNQGPFPAFRQGSPGETNCLPNDREERRSHAGCGLTAGGTRNNVGYGFPYPGTAIYFCRHYYAAGACTERCEPVSCLKPGEP
jgi:hypothetical protein